MFDYLRRWWLGFCEGGGGDDSLRNILAADSYLAERGLGPDSHARTLCRRYSEMAARGSGMIGCMGEYGKTLGARLWRDHLWEVGVEECVRLGRKSDALPDGPERRALVDQENKIWDRLIAL